jgi:dihydrofolate reductase
MASLIIGVARNGVIGQGLEIPWYYPEDLKWFKKTTMGGVLIMGRKTYESLKGRKLPGREIIVLSRSQETYPNKVPTMMDAIYLAGTRWADRPVWIAGGADIYVEALRLNLVSKIYHTLIPEEPIIRDDSILIPSYFLQGFVLEEEIINENDDRLVHQVYQCSQQ